jgi:hypothetical protein
VIDVLMCDRHCKDNEGLSLGKRKIVCGGEGVMVGEGV